jgi:predicted DNA-binding transcriptional regulator AlpA
MKRRKFPLCTQSRSDHGTSHARGLATSSLPHQDNNSGHIGSTPALAPEPGAKQQMSQNFAHNLPPSAPCSCNNVYLSAPQVKYRYGGISDMTLWRWLNKDFPKPVVIAGRRYWYLPTLQIYEKAHVEPSSGHGEAA